MRKLIVRTARMLTDCLPVKYGLKKMDENRIEYRVLDAILTDDMAKAALKMGVRRPVTPESLSKKLKWDVEKTRAILDEMADIGIVEYNRHNPQRQKQYVLPCFVVGSAENLILNKKLMQKVPELPHFFLDMAREPLEPIVGMVPPGGAGLGFHAIPVERSIPKSSQSVDIEHLSHWLKKYNGQYAIMPCVCRTSMIAMGKGCGELPEETCISLGDYSDYLVETGKARRATYDEIMDVLKRTEELGYMHQITNGDGGDDIFSICNCSVGNCFALRTSQLFNAPNLSASCYRAYVDKDRCVACGKCVEVCPAGAVKLGRRLCTKEGPVKYAASLLPSEKLFWGKDNWNENYRNDNRVNTYPTGTSPCKSACPAHVSIQGVLKLAGDGRDLAALELLRQDNPFPSLCSELCSHPCEAACTKGSVDKPMHISSVISALADIQEKYKDKLIPAITKASGVNQDNIKRIAVMGSGPDSLSCAYFLAVMGYKVTLFSEDPVCSDAELYILEKMGVIFSSGEPDRSRYDAVYPDVFGSSADCAAGMIEDGREAAVSIHRHVHEGHDQSIARDPRCFTPIDKQDVLIAPEQIKSNKCLECGMAWVDTNRCIGCGICTTRCMFGAIKLDRSNPEYENYVTYDKAKINTAVNGAKQITKVVISRACNHSKNAHL